MKSLSIALLIAGLLTVPVFASPIVVDAFTDPQFFSLDPPEATPESNGIATTSSLGLFRNVTLDRVTGSGQESVNIAGGTAEINFAAADGVTSTFIWDGDSNNVLNPTGLGGVDLTQGGTNTQISLGIRSDLAGAPLTLTVYTDGTNFSTASFNSPGGGFGGTPFTEIQLPFSSFSIGGGTGADFANVGAVTLHIDATGPTVLGTDIQLSAITANGVPEPATWLMMLSGLGLVIGGRKLRRRA